MTNAAVRESTIKSLQGSTLTRHHGRPTYKGVAKTRKEVAQAYAKVKTLHSAFPMGRKFGLASAVLKNRGFINIHNAAAVNIPEAEDLDEAWKFEHPTCPKPYNETELPQGPRSIRTTKGHEKKETRSRTKGRNCIIRHVRGTINLLKGHEQSKTTCKVLLTSQ